MPRAEQSHPYEEFLAAHRRLSQAADSVLSTIGAFGQLITRDELRAAAAGLREEVSSATGGGFAGILERQLRPAVYDATKIRRLALACRATEVALGHPPWHHQVVAALLLDQGVILEMPNGSGKTLAAALAACVGALGGERVHVVTHNDYLSERDVRWMGAIYDLLGLSVGVVFSQTSSLFTHGVREDDGHLRVMPRAEVSPAERPAAEATKTASGGDGETEPGAAAVPPLAAPEGLVHEPLSEVEIDFGLGLERVLACDVVHGSIASFGLAYLGDQLLLEAGAEKLARRDLLLVDECDAVLLDDLQVPLVRSRSEGLPWTMKAATLHRLQELAGALHAGRDFLVKGNQIELTFRGVARVRELTGLDVFTEERSGLALGLVNALKALFTLQRDVDYLVEDATVKLIDRDSGRVREGNRYSNGLHEALEVKEGLPVATGFAHSCDLARISIHNFVRTYRRVSGMSGVVGDPAEYLHFYGLETVSLTPFRRTRRDHPDLIYRTREGALDGAVELAREAAEKGRPVLVNVPDLRGIDALARRMARTGLRFQALDARNVRTLGEEAEAVARAAEPGLVTICSRVAARGTDIRLGPAAIAAGGLRVIGVERGIDRRYDDQLRGRAGRKGEPGDSRFVDSSESPLMMMLAHRLGRLMDTLGVTDQTPVESAFVSRSIEAAQRNNREHHRKQRRSLVEQDDILARHRLVFYDLRRKLLAKPELRDEVDTILDNWAAALSEAAVSPADGGLPGLGALASAFAPLELERARQIKGRRRRVDALVEILRGKLRRLAAEPDFGRHAKLAILVSLDRAWERTLRDEERLREEMAVRPLEPSQAAARFADQMERSFDGFFYEVGEWVLASLVSSAEPGSPAAEAAA